MTTDEIEALAKYLSGIGFRGPELASVREFMDACDKSAAALRQLMARVSELERERDIAFNEGLEAAARECKIGQKIRMSPKYSFPPGGESVLMECLALGLTAENIRSLKRPKEAT